MTIDLPCNIKCTWGGSYDHEGHVVADYMNASPDGMKMVLKIEATDVSTNQPRITAVLTMEQFYEMVSHMAYKSAVAYSNMQEELRKRDRDDEALKEMRRLADSLKQTTEEIADKVGTLTEG